MKDLVLHGQLKRIGQFESVASEELDAIVDPGIVRGRDDHAGVKAVRARQESNRRSRHNAGTLHVCSCPAQSSGKRGRDPRARFAGITTQDDSRLGSNFSKGVAEGQASGKDRGWVERGLSCDAANTVGSEEFSNGCCAHGLTSWIFWI